MEIIPEIQRPCITLSVLSCPENIGMDDLPAITVGVRIVNRSTLAVASTGPYPLHISYFWIHPDGSMQEGQRTRFHAPVEPGQAVDCQMTFPRPSTTGRFTLRLTLVQEQVCWFSDPPVSHFEDRMVELRSEPWWTAGGEPIFGDNEVLNHKKYASRLSFAGGNRPLMLTIETVNTCNFDCIFCPYSAATREKSVMPLELFQLALDQYVAIGGGALSMTPMVGDVFLDRFLPDRFRLIRQRPAITNLSFSTNASLFQTVSDEDFEYIISQLYRLHISIYGVNAEEHTTITRRATFDRVMANTRRALDAAGGDRDKVVLGFRLLRERSREFLTEWIEKHFGRPCEFGWTTQYMNWVNGVDTTRRLPLDGQWIQLTAAPRSQCLLPLMACHIYSNGDVSFCPCDDYNGMPDLHLGNITKKPLAELYNSERVRGLWKKLPAVCDGCTAYRPLTNMAFRRSAQVHGWVMRSDKWRLAIMLPVEDPEFPDSGNSALYPYEHPRKGSKQRPDDDSPQSTFCRGAR